MDESTSAVFAELLNKESFESALKESGLNAEQIEAEWTRLVQLFSFTYLQHAYEALTQEQQLEAVGEIPEEPTLEEIQSFSSKMTKFLEDNPDSIDRKQVINQAAEASNKLYSEAFKGGK